jgi:hypothetical protein
MEVNSLYLQDLRVWTIFRAEVAHFKTQHIAYRKTGMEWEILAELGMRLHHKEESKEAYQRCLDSQRYSIKPWLKLMEIYADEGDLQRTLQTAIRVAAYQYGDYTEMTVCLPEHVLRSPPYAEHYTVSDCDSEELLQTRADTRPHKDRVHSPKHGASGPDTEDHGGLFVLRSGVQGRGLRLLNWISGYVCMPLTI